MKKKEDNNRSNKMLIESINYIIFGILTVVINITSFAMFDKVGIPYIFNNIISFIISVIFAFYTNKIYVFKSKDWNRKIILKEGISFFSCRIFTFFIDTVLLIILVENIGVNNILSKCIINVVVIVLNYILSKVWIFK